MSILLQTYVKGNNPKLLYDYLSIDTKVMFLKQISSQHLNPVLYLSVVSVSAGIQGQLWTELVRTWDQMDGMIFPRLLCVAERGWHKASWENVHDKYGMMFANICSAHFMRNLMSGWHNLLVNNRQFRNCQSFTTLHGQF